MRISDGLIEMLIIEDDAIYELVIQKILDAGVPRHEDLASRSGKS